jgi:hypothetical protein
MIIKAVNGVDVKLMDDENGNCVYFPNPGKEETKMGLWNDLFGEGVAKIMRANYLSHSKNGFNDENGNKVRIIRNLEGVVVKELELKDTDGTGRSTKPNVALKDAIDLYKELVGMKNPALAKAIGMQMTIVKSLVNPVLMEADIDTLRFIIDLKKAEEKATVEEKK